MASNFSNTSSKNPFPTVGGSGFTQNPATNPNVRSPAYNGLIAAAGGYSALNGGKGASPLGNLGGGTPGVQRTSTTAVPQKPNPGVADAASAFYQNPFSSLITPANQPATPPAQTLASGSSTGTGNTNIVGGTNQPATGFNQATGFSLGQNAASTGGTLYNPTTGIVATPNAGTTTTDQANALKQGFKTGGAPVSTSPQNNAPNGVLPSWMNDPNNPYGAAVAKAQAASAQYNKDYGAYANTQKAINKLSETGALSPAITGLSAAVAAENTPILQSEQANVTNLNNQAGLAAPTTQFGVLTSPVTGQPITPGQTAGSAAFSGGQTQQQQSQGSVYQGYKAAANSAKNLQGQLNSLITNAGINPSDINALNTGIQKIAANTSDPSYKTFNNLLTDLSSVYAQILTPPGSTTTDYQTSLAHSLLDASQSGAGISDVIKNLDAQVEAKMAGVYSAGTGTTNPTLNSASTNSVAPAGFGWNP